MYNRLLTRVLEHRSSSLIKMISERRSGDRNTCSEQRDAYHR